MPQPIRKAVFPAAGLGTRFLPATKAQPKEMLPLVDKPTIQYGVEEAVASGVSNLILVTGRGKNAIEDHFDVSSELEALLERRGKTDLLNEIRKISNLINVGYVRQGEPLGLGHAVLVTKALVGNEPFAVVLGDDVIDASPPALQQMIEVYNRLDAPVLAVERVPESDVSNYGIVDVDPAESLGPTVHRVRDLVEKPPRSEAPSNLAIIGRYLLTPDIYPALEATSEDRTGEIQLTNGLRRLLKSRPIYTCEISGVRHDTGNKLGYLKAMVYFALRRPDLAEPFREYLEGLDLRGAGQTIAKNDVATKARRTPRTFGISLRDFVTFVANVPMFVAATTMSEAASIPTSTRSSTRSSCPPWSRPSLRWTTRSWRRSSIRRWQRRLISRTCRPCRHRRSCPHVHSR